MYPIPHFLIIGAMKSGTTSLYDDLKTSEFFDLPDVKEPGVLVKTTERATALRRYRLHFTSSDKDQKVRGEGSTYYTMQPLFPDISKFAMEVCGPRLKIVIILRNPVDRIISHVRHDYSAGRVNFQTAEKIISSDPRYLAFSDYPRQLSPWIETFGKENIFCISFYDYVSNRLAVTKEVAQFLGVDSSSLAVRRSVSNPNSNIRRNLVPQKVVEAYRLHFRRFVPRGVHHMGLQLATIKAQQSGVIDFSERFLTELNEAFAGMENELYRLTGQDITLFER